MSKSRTVSFAGFHLLIGLFSVLILFLFIRNAFTIQLYFVYLMLIYIVLFSFISFFKLCLKFFFMEKGKYISYSLYPVGRQSYHLFYEELDANNGYMLKNIELISNGRVRSISYTLCCPCGHQHHTQISDPHYMGYVHELMITECPECHVEIPRDSLKIKLKW